LPLIKGDIDNYKILIHNYEKYNIEALVAIAAGFLNNMALIDNDKKKRNYRVKKRN